MHYFFKFLFVSLLIMAFGCGTKEKIDPAKLPSWYFVQPKSETLLYGTALADSMQEALDEALFDLIAKLNVELSDSITLQNHRAEYETIVTLRQTFISQYNIEQMEQVGNKRVLLLSMARADLVEKIVLQKRALTNDLSLIDTSESLHVLTLLEALHKKEEIAKRLDFLNAILLSLGEMQKREILANAYTKEIEYHRAKIKIFFESKMNPRLFPELFAQIQNSLLYPQNAIMRDALESETFPMEKTQEIALDAFYVMPKLLFGSDAKEVIMSDREGYIYTLNRKTEQFERFKAHKSGIEAVALSDDGSKIVSADEFTLRYYDLANKQHIRELRHTHHSARYEATKSLYKKGTQSFFNMTEAERPNTKMIKFLKNNRYVLTGSNWQVFRIWDLRSGRVLEQYDFYERSKITNATFIQAAASPSERLLALCVGGHISIVSRDTKKSIALFEAPNEIQRERGFTTVEFLDNNSLVATLDDGRLLYWDFRANKNFLAAVTKEPVGNILIENNHLHLLSDTSYRVVSLEQLKKLQDSKILSGAFDRKVVSYECSSSKMSAYSKDELLFMDQLIERKIFFYKRKSAKDLHSNEPLFDRYSLFFDFESCAEAYRAIESYGLFKTNIRGVEIYQGCNLVSVRDRHKNEFYSKRVSGSKIEGRRRTMKFLSDASYDSFHSKEGQESRAEMLKEMQKHPLLRFIMRGE